MLFLRFGKKKYRVTGGANIKAGVGTEGKSYNIQTTLDAKVRFDQLDSGTYSYRIDATDASGKSITPVIQNFTVPSTAVNGTITIKYDANGGSYAPGSHSVTAGSSGNATFTLSNSIPTRTGYEFLCWRLENDPSYGQFYPGQSISINFGSGNHTVTYYAVWNTVLVTPEPEPEPDAVPVLTFQRFKIDWINWIITPTYEKDGTAKTVYEYTFGCDIYVECDYPIDEYGFVLLDSSKKQIAVSSFNDTMGVNNNYARRQFPIHQTTFTETVKNGVTSQTTAQKGILATLEAGKTYYGCVYVICGGKLAESQMQSFVFMS